MGTALVRLRLVLLRHNLVLRVYVAGLAPQHGHRDSRLMSARVNLMRTVVIEFGTCRSGRKGGSSGSVIGGNGRRLEERG